MNMSITSARSTCYTHTHWVVAFRAVYCFVTLSTAIVAHGTVVWSYRVAQRNNPTLLYHQKCRRKLRVSCVRAWLMVQR